MLEFAPVDLSQNGVVIQVDVFVREADWDPDDWLRVAVDLEGAPDVTLIDTSGTDIDDLATEGRWRRLGAAIPDAATSGRIQVELESDQAAEAVFLDRVSVLPEPGLGGLLSGVVLLGGLHRRSDVGRVKPAFHLSRCRREALPLSRPTTALTSERAAGFSSIAANSARSRPVTPSTANDATALADGVEVADAPLARMADPGVRERDHQRGEQLGAG